ncbi:hypothetical protein PTKIN_Ptkin02bG0254100 [Pterospermum kingtungense]
METQAPTPSANPPKVDDYRSNVDTSRPFRSVKEAVVALGNGFLLGRYIPQSLTLIAALQAKRSLGFHRTVRKEDDEQHQQRVLDTLQKLEAELEETKTELKLLKKRESETEIASASLNAELHKYMSKLAVAECCTESFEFRDGK